MDANKLQLNNEKTEVLLIGTPAKLGTIETQNIELCGELINLNGSLRNLGVYLDSQMTLNCHLPCPAAHKNLLLRVAQNISN